MKRAIQFSLFFITFISVSQTKVGEVHFNDSDTFNTTELVLNGAGKNDKRYAVGLYLDLDFDLDALEDGVKVAEKDATMAVTIKMTSSLSSDEFKTLIRNGLERATDGNSYIFEEKTRDFLGFVPNEINRYEIFKVLYQKGGKVTLLRNREVLGTIESLEFKKAFFKIWLGENPLNENLKEDLLGATSINPVLGKWKTYDKETGVAISIVQIYMIKNSVYGTIERMLRNSERDNVCFDCKGEDKNRKVEGLVILKRLKPKGENKYGDGTYTDIKDGEVSDCQIWVDGDDTDVLNVRYKGGGGTHKWRRMN